MGGFGLGQMVAERVILTEILLPIIQKNKGSQIILYLVSQKTKKGISGLELMVEE
jgi:hypothetical protein